MTSRKRYNVMLAMTDQQRFDTMRSMGGPVETVNLDFVAAQGTLFRSAYTCTPSCCPARASLLTGQDPWHTGILGMGPGQPECSNLTDTLPETLAAAGYHTQGVGKMHLRPQRSLQGFHHTVIDEQMRVEDKDFVSDYQAWFTANRPGDVGPFDHGIDSNSWIARPYHLPEYLHATNWTVDEAIRFLRRRDPTRPFFLFLSFDRPHSPYDPPAWYFDLYDRRELPRPAVGDWAGRHDVPADATDPNAWHGRHSDAEVHRSRAGYYGSIHHIDHQFGRVLRELRVQGVEDDTLVIFTADHGDMMGDHHLWRKSYAYEGSAHIPMVVRLPAALRSGTVGTSRALVCLQDVMPTILDVVGVDIPTSVDGQSMLPVIRGDEGAGRDLIHGEHSRGRYHPENENHYLVDGRVKYIWFPISNEEQLFDLASDPYECHDLAGDPSHAATLERFRKRLVSILEPREVGLVADGELVCQADRPPIRSPAAALREA